MIVRKCSHFDRNKVKRRNLIELHKHRHSVAQSRVFFCSLNTFTITKQQINKKGRHMEKLTEIRQDLFDISARIKSIDENYKIYFNRGTRRYELHDSTRVPSYQATFPYARLDKRALDFARRSAVKNSKLYLKR